MFKTVESQPIINIAALLAISQECVSLIGENTRLSHTMFWLISG